MAAARAHRRSFRASHRVIVALALLLSLYALGQVALGQVAMGQVALARGGAPSQNAVELRLKIPSTERIYVEKEADGTYTYVLVGSDDVRRLTPEAFAEVYYFDRIQRSWWMLLGNISSPIGIAWIGLGAFGQLLFAGRMVLQWLASEREGRSVVPDVFWWLSLAGATLLMTYFIWRKDIVGVIGQGTGWLIYGRNLLLVHRERSLR
jgi:lipid-A-disaccharide synthase-like uncharacterized protein